MHYGWNRSSTMLPPFCSLPICMPPYDIPSSALCLPSNVVLRFFIFFDISQNMIFFARFKSSSEAQLNFLRESSTLGYVRHYDLNRSCKWSLAQQLFEFKIVHFGAKTVILTGVKISHMKTGRKFSVILSVFPINPNTTFERKQRALDGTYCGVGALRYCTGTDRVVDTAVFALTEISRIFGGYLG